MSPGFFKSLFKVVEHINRKNKGNNQEDQDSTPPSSLGCGCLIFIVLAISIFFTVSHYFKEDTYEARCSDSRPGAYCE